MPANLIGVLLRNRHAGADTLAWAQPALGAPENMTLTSGAFRHGAPIPDRHKGHLRAPDVSPALAWTAPPPGTAELVLIVQDPDAPLRKPATHALTIGIAPTLASIPEGGLAQPSPLPGLRHGRGPLGRRGYNGPLPPRSHGPHAYVFQLFAVDVAVDLPDRFSLDETVAAIAGHVVGRARLDGTYENR
jgi:Raf kinase inhibitor-like YbhB/YbcL family protein